MRISTVSRSLIFLSLLSLSPLHAQEPPSFEEISDQAQLPLLCPSLSCREIAKIRLSNGISVYLISDPRSDLSAAAVAVQAGSWNDPKEYPGMAHFLEHMLFKGTLPYPDESEFMRYIGDHGGLVNAFTAPDRTVYSFSCDHASFLDALDRFSHFFIDPIFSASGIGRELYAVDQEFSKNIENDGWRKYQIEKETGNPNHPNRNFCTGNSKTLIGIPREAIIQWYTEHYSANLMRVVIYSPLPIDQLKTIAFEKFKGVANRNTKPLIPSETISSSRQRGHMTYISPIENLQHLSLQWELPPSFSRDSNHTAELIAYTLMRGQQKSLDEALKKEHLIESLDVDVDSLSAYSRLFHIEIDLTAKGLEQRERVIQRCFEALAVLKQENIPPYLFQELKTIAQKNYQYQSRRDAFSFVMDLARNLLDEKLESYPRETLLPSEYNPQQVHQLLSYLTPQNCQFSLLVHPEKAPFIPTQKERWMGAEYAIKEIPSDLLSAWIHASPSSDMQIPPENPFLPSASQAILPSSPTAISTPPLSIANTPAYRVFYLANNPLETPYICWIVHLKSPEIDGSARSSVLTDLYLMDLANHLSPTLLSAQAGGLDLRLITEPIQLSLVVSGYSDKALLFLQEILSTMKNKGSSKEEFEIFREALRKSYENSEKELPVIQAKNLYRHLLSTKNPLAQEKLQALFSLTYEDLLSFQTSLFEKNFLTATFSGNLSATEAKAVVQELQTITSAKIYPKDQHTLSDVLILPPNQGPFVVSRDTLSQGNGVLLSLEQGPFSFPALGAQQILSRCVSDAFFTTLRSKQKTAYIAKGLDEEIEQRLFQIFLVQSGSHEPLDLLYRFETFLEDYVQDLATYIPESRFESIKSTLILKYQNPPKNLQELTFQTDKFAFKYHEAFRWNEQAIQALKKLSYKDFLQFAQRTLSRGNKARLAVLFHGKSQQESPFIYHSLDTSEFSQIAQYQSANSSPASPSSEEESVEINKEMKAP